MWAFDNMNEPKTSLILQNEKKSHNSVGLGRRIGNMQLKI